MSLERELALFNERLPSWLAEGRKGQWACIYGDEVLGIYPDMTQAAKTGYACAILRAFNMGEPERPFLLRQITDEPEKPLRFTRNVVGELEARDARVRAEEREACARLCEELADQEVAKLADTPNVSERAYDYHNARILDLRWAARQIRERKE